MPALLEYNCVEFQEVSIGKILVAVTYRLDSP
jgi:hypothetical protein